MIKKILGLVVVISILISCGNNAQKKSETSENEIAKVTVDELLSDLQNYIDKEVETSGIVTHVCSHGGKRMFIIGDDPDAALQIIPNEEIGVFEKELEGNTVMVIGIPKELRIDESYVTNLEKELELGVDDVALHDHSGGKHDEESENEKQEQIEMMKSKIAESENGYYSQFWMEASKFKTKEHVDSDVEKHEHEEGEEHEHEEGEEHTH